MRPRFKPRELHKLPESCQARPSGSIRVASSGGALNQGDSTLRLGAPCSRPNTKLPVLPSIILDPSLLDVAYSPATHASSRLATSHRRITFLVALTGLLCGGWLGTVVVEQTRASSATATQDRLPTVTVGALTQPMQHVAPAAPDSLPLRHAPMSLRDAALRLRRAKALQRAGELGAARYVLHGLLRHRPGYPPGLATMTELELELGDSVAALHFARRAVRALPGSAAHRELLRRACAAVCPDCEYARLLQAQSDSPQEEPKWLGPEEELSCQ